jgi:hypothetical protein
VVALAYPLDARARLEDGPGGLVTEDDRERLGEIAVDHVQVAGAQTTAGHPHEDLALARRREIDLKHFYCRTRLPEYGGLRSHGASLESPACEPQSSPPSTSR